MVEVAVVTEFKSRFNYVQTVFTVLNVNKVGSLREWAQGNFLLYFRTTRVFIRIYDLRKLISVNCDRVRSKTGSLPYIGIKALRMSARKGNVRKYLIYRECVATSENQCIKYTAAILTISAILQGVSSA